MKAILTTRCGCTRELECTYPAPPTIVLPLKTRFNALAAEVPSPVYSVRTFERRRVEDFGPAITVAYYDEK